MWSFPGGCLRCFVAARSGSTMRKTQMSTSVLHYCSLIARTGWKSKNSGVFPPNHPFWYGLSIINHPFWGTPIFAEKPTVGIGLKTSWGLLAMLHRCRRGSSLEQVRSNEDLHITYSRLIFSKNLKLVAWTLTSWSSSWLIHHRFTLLTATCRNTTTYKRNIFCVFLCKIPRIFFDESRMWRWWNGTQHRMSFSLVHMIIPSRRGATRWTRWIDTKVVVSDIVFLHGLPPIPGGNDPIWFISIFFRWVGKTTNYRYNLI